jgi:hypothetical protein
MISNVERKNTDIREEKTAATTTTLVFGVLELGRENTKAAGA